MLRRNDLARIISDRFALRGGKRIPIYLGEWMIDYVFEAVPSSGAASLLLCSRKQVKTV